MAAATSSTGSLTSVSGLASGIDTKAIIDAQLNADRAPARLAEKNRAVAQAKLDAVKAMNIQMLSMRDALDLLKDKANFGAKSATSSNESAVAASSTSSAVAGSLTINVKRLATAHQVASAGQSSATTDLGSGSIVLRLASTAGSDPDITITPTTNTMTGIAEAINAANVGVSASVINDGSASPYRLVITSTKTGAVNAITKLDGTGGFAGLLPSLAGLTEVTQGLDAQVRIGDKDTGLLLQSASNTMEGAIPGLTLTLKSVADGIDVTVGQNTDSVRGKVQGFVDSYNKTVEAYSSSSKYDVATRSAGPLFGDYDIRSRLSNIQSEMTRSDDNRLAGFQSLADVGVTVDVDGKLTVNASIFDAKLAANQDAVASLFLEAGVAATVPMESLTRSTDGAMALKQSTLENSILAYTNRITTIDARLEQRKAYYQNKFLAMERIIASLNSQSNSMTSFINGLNSSKK